MGKTFFFYQVGLILRSIVSDEDHTSFDISAFYCYSAAQLHTVSCSHRQKNKTNQGLCRIYCFCAFPRRSPEQK